MNSFAFWGEMLNPSLRKPRILINENDYVSVGMQIAQVDDNMILHFDKFTR